MKHKLLTVLLAAALILTLGACSGKENAASQTPEAPIPESVSEPDSASASEAEGEEPEAGGILSQFTATDLAGQEVTQAVFEGHKVTMVNIWATFCGPCLGEMPELGELHAEYAGQGFQVLGIVTDTLAQDGSISQEQVELAQRIAEETGADYTHLLPSEDLIYRLLWQVNGVPTTIFVDETGALLGNGYVGARDKDSWKAIIEEKLAGAGEGETAS